MCFGFFTKSAADYSALIKRLFILFYVAQFAFLFHRPCMSTASDGIFMASYAAYMKRIFGLGCFPIRNFFNLLTLMQMTFMTGLHCSIRWLHLVMAGFTLGNRQRRVHLMRKSHVSNLDGELDDILLLRNRQSSLIGINAARQD